MTALGNTVLLGDSITVGYAPSLVTTGWKRKIAEVSKTSDWLLTQARAAPQTFNGATDVVLLIGTNDIGYVPTATTAKNIAMIVGLAKAGGARVFVMTLPPFKGWQNYASNYAAIEGRRQALNAAIRAAGYNVIPLDTLLASPGDPQTILPAADSGDHLHPRGGYLATTVAKAAAAHQEDVKPPSQPATSSNWWLAIPIVGAIYGAYRVLRR